jgi:Flp pilus assembly protein TadB
VTLLAAMLVAASAWLAVNPPADPRLAGLLPRATAPTSSRISRGVVAWLGSGLAALGALLTVPMPMNVLVAVGALVLLPRFLGRLESSADRRRSQALARQGPIVADLLAATLASGAPMQAALTAVGSAVDEPSRGCLRSVVAALDLGADPVEAWAQLHDDAVLSALADAVVRSSRTGAPLSSTLASIGDDMRRERRAVVEVAARTAGVRAVVPLAACFLPAFILLGVVPIVAALTNELIGS